jgi:peroxiredoxin
MPTAKLGAGAPFPQITWPRVGGGLVEPSNHTGWLLLVVYRGKHCPLCKRYLKTLNDLMGEFEEAQIAVAAISADPLEKAQADVEEHGWRFPVGYDLTPPQMRELGLYISDPRSPDETDRQFSEPGVFVVNGEKRAQIIDISNAPFARPDLRSLLDGVKFVKARDYPIRGCA